MSDGFVPFLLLDFDYSSFPFLSVATFRCASAYLNHSCFSDSSCKMIRLILGRFLRNLLTLLWKSSLLLDYLHAYTRYIYMQHAIVAVKHRYFAVSEPVTCN